jgi:hypothetical protein
MIVVLGTIKISETCGLADKYSTILIVDSHILYIFDWFCRQQDTSGKQDGDVQAFRIV